MSTRLGNWDADEVSTPAKRDKWNSVELLVVFRVGLL